MGRAPTPSATVVVVTFARPDHVELCLRHLLAQTVDPREIIVVDASPDSRTAQVVATFDDIVYLRNTRGRGTTGYSRNLGLSAATGDVVAFVDDDAYADPPWLERLLGCYADTGVGGVGGRASNGIAGEELTGLDDIGKFHEDGTLSGNFGADPGQLVEVDHFIGANMSFRRDALVAIGGIRDGYPGTCLREETDLAFRVRAAGWRLVYNPAARVHHVAGPYAQGRRFDIRYAYFAERSHLVLLVRTLGVRSPQLRRSVWRCLRGAWAEGARGLSGLRGRGEPGSRSVRAVSSGLVRSAAALAGLAVGLSAGLHQRRLDARKEPIRA